MSVKFQLRSTSLDAYYASGFKAHASFPNNAGLNPLLVSDASAGIFGGSKLNLGDGVGQRGLMFSGLDNFSLNSAFTILMRVIPTWTGAPATRVPLCSIGSNSGAAGVGSSGIQVACTPTGSIFLIAVDKLGFQNVFTEVAHGGNIPFVSGTPIDIWLSWDGSINNGSIKCYTANNGNAPTLFGTGDPNSASNGVDKLQCGNMAFGVATSLGGTTYPFWNEVAIWDTVVDPTSFGTRVGFITTTASAFEAYFSTDPGAASVLQGVTYTSAGVAKIGLLDEPAIGDVRAGVVYYETTRTGVLNIPAVADVRAGTTFDNATKTGLLDIPVIANVAVGVSYDNATKTGTLLTTTMTQAQLTSQSGGLVASGLTITQGDTVSFRLLAVDGTTGLPFNLTGCSITSQVQGYTGVLDSSHVTINADQAGHTGQFLLTVLSAESNLFSKVTLGEIVCTATKPGFEMAFHGKGLLTVLLPTPGLNK
jgi:hypothetical protein